MNDNISSVTHLPEDLVLIRWNTIRYSESVGTLIFIGAYITAKARSYLRFLMKGIEPHVCYCDTDSIHTTVQIDSRHLDDKKLGYLKMEYKFESAYYLAPKHYLLWGGGFYKNKKGENYVFKCKGVRESAFYKDNMTPEEKFESILNKYEEYIEKGVVRLINENIFLKSFNKIKIIREMNKDIRTFHRREFDPVTGCSIPYFSIYSIKDML